MPPTAAEIDATAFEQELRAGRELTVLDVRDADAFAAWHLAAPHATVVNLTEDAPGYDGRPSWRPDGRKLVFESDRTDPGGRIEIFTMDADGSNVRQLTHNALFPKDCMHIENLGGDIDAPELQNKRLILGCFPWKFKGGEAAFCRAVAFTGEWQKP